MLPKSVLIASLLFCAAAANAADGHLYQATLSQSDWQASQDDQFCYLAHGIPYFGVALFAGGADNQLQMTLYTRRPPAVEAVAQVVTRRPRWESQDLADLGTTRIWPGPATFRMNHHMSNVFLETLEAGRLPELRFSDWHDQTRTVTVALSQAGFKPAYGQFLQCMAKRTKMPKGETAPPTDLLSRMGYGSLLATSAHPDTVTKSDNGNTTDTPDDQQVRRIYFTFDSAGLSRDSEQELRKLAKQLRRDQTVAVVLAVGHTDNVGPSSYNDRLSLRRARSVRDFLADQGVDRQRIRISGAGEASPAAPNDNEFDRAANRRVEIRLGGNG